MLRFFVAFKKNKRTKKLELKKVRENYILNLYKIKTLLKIQPLLPYQLQNTHKANISTIKTTNFKLNLKTKKVQILKLF